MAPMPQVQVKVQVQQPGQRAVLGLLAVSAAAGAVAAVGVVLFLAAEHQLHHLVWVVAPTALGAAAPPVWWAFPVLLIGALGVFAALRLPGGGGHRPMAGLSFDAEPRDLLSIVPVALISLSAGVVLGPEAPLLAIGSAAGALLAVRLPKQARTVVMTGGATGALTLVFGNPLVAGLLVLEAAVLKGSPGGRRAVLMLLPVLIAMGTGYLVQVGVGDWSGVGEASLAVPGLPSYEDVGLIDLAVTVPLAVLAAVVVIAALRLGEAVQRLGTDRPFAVLVGGALVIAAAAAVAALQDGVSTELVLFSGQDAIPDMLTVTSLATVATVAIAKTVAYGVSLGSGFRGGQVFPAVFLGVAIAVAAADLVPAANLSAAVAAGIAAGVAAVLRMPFTAVLLAVLLTAGAGLAVTTPAILGAVIGFMVRASLDARSTAHAGVAQL